MTRTDDIFADLIANGYLEGTISDREYARLKALTGLSGMSMMDMYRAAGEDPRLYGIGEINVTPPV